MTAAIDPPFETGTELHRCQVSAAGANWDGASGTVALMASAAYDRKLDLLKYRGGGAVAHANGMVRIYHVRAATKYLLHEFTVTGSTPAATVQQPSGEERFLEGFPLPAGDTLEAQTHNAEVFNVYAVTRKF